MSRAYLGYSSDRSVSKKRPNQKRLTRCCVFSAVLTVPGARSTSVVLRIPGAVAAVGVVMQVVGAGGLGVCETPSPVWLSCPYFCPEPVRANHRAFHQENEQKERFVLTLTAW